jgi:PAS domain S-box-containing protein
MSAPFGSSTRLHDEHLAAFVDMLADAVVIADADGTIIVWNRAAERVLGWSTSEALGQTLDLIIPERFRERHWAGYRSTMATGRTQYGDRLLEVPALHRDGSTLSIAFTVTLLREQPDAHPYGIAAVVRDDTSRWRERRRLNNEIATLRDELNRRWAGRDD